LDNPQEARMDAQAEKALLLAILIQSVRDMRGDHSRRERSLWNQDSARSHALARE
jgi:hypothetical protein